jgi:hypothetical protein
MSSTCSNNVWDKNGFFCAAAMARQSLGRASKFDDFPRQFVLLLQDQSREVGGIFQIRDDDAFDADAEALNIDS